MAYITQPLPPPNHPFLTSDMTIDPIWYRFVTTIFNRTGGSSGSSASGTFIYPSTMGLTGQYLQSTGSGNEPVWATLDSLSQFSNDANFITIDALAPYATSESPTFTGNATLEQDSGATVTNDQLVNAGWVQANTVASIAGLQGTVTLAQLVSAGVAPTASPTFTGVVVVPNLVISSTNAVILAGNGAPSGVQVNGSLYLRADGGVSTRIYVSRGGGTWVPITGV